MGSLRSLGSLGVPPARGTVPWGFLRVPSACLRRAFAVPSRSLAFLRVPSEFLRRALGVPSSFLAPRFRWCQPAGRVALERRWPSRAHAHAPWCATGAARTRIAACRSPHYAAPAMANGQRFTHCPLLVKMLTCHRALSLGGMWALSHSQHAQRESGPKANQTRFVPFAAATMRVPCL